MNDLKSPQRETILVVDDDPATLRLVVEILRIANFLVLSANSGSRALQLAESAPHIDLLLSDVEMDDMTGPDLGEALKKLRPDLHVMLMSRGSKGNLLVLNYGWAFLRKPFLPARLVQMVNDVLHSPNRSQPG